MSRQSCFRYLRRVLLNATRHTSHVTRHNQVDHAGADDSLAAAASQSSLSSVDAQRMTSNAATAAAASRLLEDAEGRLDFVLKKTVKEGECVS